ncbi:MAG: hypothetical protein A3F92_09580 [Candidatus Rokubacteria bacterium RIFCSPLOWO2_12_FULL_71_22]|nr:hypothetical protein [Candidatus Rokubacteria bacterium]OGL08519.1 MAG: hypothetical protein A3I17_11780 [Candidatus Rokubacteria bacterium RIFCSPLOWO2_02_FULL_72_37]OGL15226.1 MAG: hypothetical protein A3F92_09580 [Candidatus Rokubacteria bacterium RIFCSPLOWO2_12_FULL_71_22]
MADVLHLLTGTDAAFVADVVERQVSTADRVTVALLPGGAAPGLPAGVTVRRLGHDLTYPQLLDLIFAADQVITW